MRRLLIALAEVGRYSAFHCFVIALAGTGAAICLTAGDLGPFAPLLISQGIFLVLLALLVEAFWWSRVAVAAAARRLLARTHPKHAQAPVD